jgi:hypothetical protein
MFTIPDGLAMKSAEGLSTIKRKPKAAGDQMGLGTHTI